MTNIFLVVGLGFGDEGKGTIVDALVRKYDAGLVVRYNGGPQASHTVCTEDGRVHSFSQFGSGTFVPKTYTLFAATTLVNPLSLLLEAEELAKKNVPDALQRLFLDGRATMITPYHRAVNRLREMARGKAKHGSCGGGVGECVDDALAHPEEVIRMQDFNLGSVLLVKLQHCCARMQKKANAIKGLPDTPEVAKQLSTFNYDMTELWRRYSRFYQKMHRNILDDYAVTRLLSSHESIVFEGAQGVLLDQSFGFHPHTTWSDTTIGNARLILEEAEIVETPNIIGVIRSYMTRHGAGPFPTEQQAMTRRMADPNNPRNDWQDNVRSGYLDMPLIQYALKVNGPVDNLAVTHLDKVTDPWLVAYAYDRAILKMHDTLEGQEKMGKELARVHCLTAPVKKANFAAWLAQTLETPVGITSEGPAYKDKKFHGALALA